MPDRKKSCNVCVVGVGAVGVEILRVLRQRKFPIQQLTVLDRSDRTVEVDGRSYEVKPVSAEAFEGQGIVLFAGTEGEKGAAVTYAPEAIRRGAVCVDNGADFRMDPNVPLVVPEVNPDDLEKHAGLIANPNCSTIQMVVALAPIHRRFRLKRVIVSTYQAASSAGSKAAEALREETSALLEDRPPPKPEEMPQRLGFNVFPQIGPFQELGYTSEEWKLVKETHKILHDNRIPINPTAVRVPVFNAHSESIYFETAEPATLSEIRQIWRRAAGLRLVEEPGYPTPAEASHRDEVFVGRLRPDPVVKNAFSCWVVSDNLRKGAALNAVQIAELLFHAGLRRHPV